MFHFFKANFDTSFVYALAAVFRQMELICANDIPGRNLPILNFAYRLHSQTVSQLVNAKHVFHCSVPEPHNSNSDDSNSPRTGTKSNFPWISPHFPVTFTRR